MIAVFNISAPWIAPRVSPRPSWTIPRTSPPGENGFSRHCCRRFSSWAPLSTLAIVPFLLRRGMWTVALADVAALGWIYAIWRFKRLGYTLRVLHFLAVVYALSITLMLSVGAASLSYLLGPPLIAAVLLSLRPALLALGGRRGVADRAWRYRPHHPEPARLGARSGQGVAGGGVELRDHRPDAHPDLHDAAQGALPVAGRARTDLGGGVAPERHGADRQGGRCDRCRATDHLRQRRLPERRTGYTRDEVIGHSLHMLRGPDTDRDEIVRIEQAMRDNRSSNAEVLVYHRSGEAFWVELEIVPFSPRGRTRHPLGHGRAATSPSAARRPRRSTGWRSTTC